MAKIPGDSAPRADYRAHFLKEKIDRELFELRATPPSPAKNNKIEQFILDFSSCIYSKLRTFNYQRYGIDRDDLVQEVSIRIWKALSNGHTIRKFRPYLKKIVDSVVIDEIRKSRKDYQAAVLQAQSASGAPSSPGPGIGDDGHLKDLLLESLQGLKESRRRVLSLYLRDYTLDEIAELSNWTRGKTQNLFYRGLRDLKKKLNRGGILYED